VHLVHLGMIQEAHEICPIWNLPRGYLCLMQGERVPSNGVAAEHAARRQGGNGTEMMVAQQQRSLLACYLILFRLGVVMRPLQRDRYMVSNAQIGMTSSSWVPLYGHSPEWREARESVG